MCATRKLTAKDSVKVRTLSGVIEPRLNADGRVTVDMGAPVFEPALVPFDAAGLSPQSHGSWETWPLALAAAVPSTTISVAVLSMGNPHAVQRWTTWRPRPCAAQGLLIENHARLPRRGQRHGFLQVLDRSKVKLRVWERGAGETLACGTGACAAVVAGIRLGLLDGRGSTCRLAARPADDRMGRPAGGTGADDPDRP